MAPLAGEHSFYRGRQLIAWFLALELVAVAVPFSRRGGTTIPLAAIIVMPAAFADGVLLAHETLRTT